MSTKLTSIEDEREGRRLAAAIRRKFQITARVDKEGKAGFQIVTDHADVGGEKLRRIRKYAEGWKDSLAEAR